MSPTPILDLESPPPEQRRSWFARTLGAAAGAAVVLALVNLPARFPAFNGLLLIPALYLAVAVHEVGHLLAGKLVDMEPGGINICGIAICKSGDRWVCRIDWRQFGGGFAKPLPRKGELRPEQFAWMVAGGPVASILLTMVCSLFIARDGSGAHAWLGTLFWMAALTITSLIPYSTGVNKSDGARLWLLRVHPEDALPWMALLKVQTEEAHGIQPAGWDADLVQQMMATRTSAPEYSYIRLLACYRSADQTDEPAAAEHLENALAHSARSGPAMRHCLFLEASSVVALAHGNANAARTWLDRARKLRKPESEESVLGAIAFCEDRYEEAAQHFSNALAFFERRRLDSGLARFAKKKIRQYRALALKAGKPIDWASIAANAD